MAYTIELKQYSASKLNEFKECPLKFFLRYGCGFKPQPNKYFTKGNILHKVAETAINIYNSEQRKLYEDEIDQIIYDELAKTPENVKSELDIKEIEKEAHAIRNSTIIPQCECAEKEFVLYIPFYGEDIILKEKWNNYIKRNDYFRILGKIDAIIKTDNSVKIVDWKTGQYRNAETVKQDFQTMVYGLYAIEAFPDVDNYSIDYVHISKNLSKATVAFTNKDGLLKQRLLNRVRDWCIFILMEEHFAPVRSYKCRYCDFREVCEQVQKMMTENVHQDIIIDFVKEYLNVS